MTFGTLELSASTSVLLQMLKDSPTVNSIHIPNKKKSIKLLSSKEDKSSVLCSYINGKCVKKHVLVMESTSSV